VAAASRRHRTHELTGGEVTRLCRRRGMPPEAASCAYVLRKLCLYGRERACGGVAAAEVVYFVIIE
jgi:hypothetical protein